MSTSRKKVESSLRRWGLILLAAALLCTLWPGNATRAEEDSAAIAFPYHKASPLVTVQGNIVVDNGKPTGFYELALCVQTKYITDAAGRLVSQEEYDKLEDKTGYTVHNAGDFSFQSVAASLKINTDVLTPVRWDAPYPEYATWNSEKNAYEANDYNLANRQTHFARGLDFDTADITNIRSADYHSQARLDTAKPDEINAATALVEHYADATDTTAILTLSATAPAEGVVYNEKTEVVVVRFAYDLKRFPDANAAFGVWENDDRNGAPDYSALVTYLSTDEEAAKSSVNQSVWFQAGLKKNADPTQLPPDYTMFYYYQGANYTNTVKDDTDNTKDKKVDVNVKLQGGGTQKVSLALPATAGRMVLTEDAAAETVHEKYSYLKNLLRTAPLGDDRQTLFFQKVSQETYRKPTGGTGGTQILFYDWDDTLIGSLIVDKGDVRAEVNKYIEENLVHPDLRASNWVDTVTDKTKNLFGMEIFQNPNYDMMVGGMGATGEAIQSYKNVLDSLERKYTYRGKYSCDPDVTDSHVVTNGEQFPLTNKLDYAFYRRVNTVTTVTDGTQYYTVQPVSADENSALYPYVYGWAVIADETVKNQDDWYLRKDAVQTEKVWTTCGSGEYSTDNSGYARPEEGAEPNGNEMPTEVLADADSKVTYPGGLAKMPTCAAAASASLLAETVERVEAPLEADAAPLEGALTEELPLGEDVILAEDIPAAEEIPTVEETPSGEETSAAEDAVSTSVDMLAAGDSEETAKVPDSYFFRTSASAGSDNLRFADFSDVDAMLTVDPVTGDKKNVLIVKAVYEQGRSLEPYVNYRVVDGSLNVERYSTAASTDNATYSFQYQYERANIVNEVLVGVGRVREPGVKTGMTYDVEEFDQDNNPNQAFYIKNITTNTDIMDVDLTTSGTIWRLSYILVDMFNLNIATGTVRSAGGELKLSDNFTYENQLPYIDRQGSNGFVMEATMNTLMKEATAAARGEDNKLSDHFELETILDLNLRRNEDGDAYTGLSNYRVCTQYLQELVTEMYEHKDALPEYFDTNGNVKLTWHQLQREIILRNAKQGSIFDSTTDTVLTDEECAGFTWCRLCTGDDDPCKNKKIDILTYGDMLKAIKAKEEGNETKYNEAMQAFWEKTNASTFGFRKDTDGIPYNITTSAGQKEFEDDMLRAYRLLAANMEEDPWKASWKVVQEAIAQDKYNATPTFNYWWGPEGTPPAIETWKDLLKYSIQEYIGVDDNGTLVKLPGAFDGFDENDLKTLVSVHKEGEPDNLGWFRTGEVDASGEKAIEFTVSEFRAALERALPVLKEGNPVTKPSDLDNIPWEVIQWALINGSYKSYGDIINDKSIDYWWKNGGSPKLTLKKLLPALRGLNEVNPALMDELLKNGIDPINNELYLRKANGVPYDDVTDFQGNAQNAMAYFRDARPTDYNNRLTDDGSIDLSWHELQWLLIHYEELVTSPMPSEDEIKSSEDYWWYQGGKPTGPMYIGSAKDLVRAALYVQSGSTAALDNVDMEQLKDFGLRYNKLGGTYTAADDKTAFLEKLKTAVSEMNLYTVDNISRVDEADIRLELQYLLMDGTNAYKPASALRTEGTTYWWQTGGTLAVTDQTSLLQMAWMTYVEDHPTPEAKAALGAMDLDFLSRRAKDETGGLAIRRNEEGNPYIALDPFLNALSRGVNWLKTDKSISYDTVGTVGPYQLQYVIINDPPGADYTEEAQMAEVFKDIYWWKTSDKKPGGAVIVEKEVSDADWKEFTDALIPIWSANIMDPSAMETLISDKGGDAAYFSDILLLQRADDSGTIDKFADGDFMSLSDRLFAVLLSVDPNGERFFDENYDIVNPPTWAEFQYLLLNYAEMESSMEMPSTEDCAKANTADNYPWKWTESGGTVEIVEKEVSDADWKEFTDALIPIWSANIMDPSAMETLISDKGGDAAYFSDILLLQRADDSGTIDKFADGDFMSLSDRLFAVLLSVDPNGERFFDENYDIVNPPTWAEFQYLLLNYAEMESSMEMPSTEDCAKANTADNYPWKWTTKETVAKAVFLNVKHMLASITFAR